MLGTIQITGPEAIRAPAARDQSCYRSATPGPWKALPAEAVLTAPSASTASQWTLGTTPVVAGALAVVSLLVVIEVLGTRRLVPLARLLL